ncbi:MAG: YihY/virulence factor BrkB family protein [Ruminococcaceae bacterium]|nr:YihY/virulence factor BrkB family protein [Oscillospiraceae bacterium]
MERIRRPIASYPPSVDRWHPILNADDASFNAVAVLSVSLKILVLSFADAVIFSFSVYTIRKEICQTAGRQEIPMKQSHIVRFDNIAAFFRRISRTYAEDRVSVYAAQASFFVVISAMPLFSLITTVLRYIAPEQITVFQAALNGAVPEFMLQALYRAFDGIRQSTTVPFVSLSAVMILWSASRGIGAVREGVQTVYHAARSRGYFYKKLLSLLYTLCFIVLIIAVVTVLLFGEYIRQLTFRIFPDASGVLDSLLTYRIPLLLLFFTAVFTALYTAAARRSTVVSHGILRHIPGAFCSALGWVLFSRIYSLYLTGTDTASFLYGGLAALCLSMLWLYACMLILLSGAEINKLFFAAPPVRMKNR